MQNQKKFWVMLLSAILFLSGALLGFSAVYRVEKVTLESYLVSEEAKAQAEALQTRLEEAYVRESIFFANEEEAQKIMTEFPYFRLVGFEKSHPNRLIFKITEDAEVYAVATQGNNYYILGEDGTVLGVRETPVNILNGAENVLIKGLSVVGENGKLPTGDPHCASVLALCKELSSLLGGIRSNVVSVEVFTREPETIYRVTMREGVKLYFGTPAQKTREKAEAAVRVYRGLTDEQKLSGRIVISANGEEIFTDYLSRDEFDK